MPRRYLCVIAALLTQIAGGACLLLGTVAFALTMQGGGEHALVPILAGWVIASLSGIVCGGLVYRGSVVALIVAALLDALFGIVLLQLSTTLGGLLRMLDASDISMVEGLVQGLGIGMLVAAAMCLAAIPQGRRYSGHTSDLEKLAPADAPEPERRPTDTAPGFPPPPVRVKTAMRTVMLTTAPARRRRLWFAIAGLAVGLGSGIAVLATTMSVSGAQKVSETEQKGSSKSGTVGAGKASSKGSASGGGGSGSGNGSSNGSSNGSGSSGGSSNGSGSGSGSSSGSGSGSGKADDALALDTPQELIVAELKAIGAGDAKALARLAIADVFAFGIAADEVAEGRDAVEAILAHDLGKVPADGFSVDSRYLQIGEWRDHVWIAEELAIGPRRFSITQLAAKIGGRWSVVAWHWAVPIPDAQAERLAAAHTMPSLKSIADRHDGPDALDDSFRNALFSRQAFADAYATRDEAFNFGSAPGEHVVGGATIKKLFSRINATLHLTGGIRTSGGNQWDKSQASGAWIGFGAANVEFTQPHHATQTFRVLAILVKEDAGWQIVQTQFSNGG